MHGYHNLQRFKDASNAVQALGFTNCAYVLPTDWLAQAQYIEVGTW